MIIRFLTPILFLIFLSLDSIGQISQGGSPASFSLLKRAAFEIPVIDMAPVKNEELLREERAESYRLKPYRFAKDFTVDLSPENAGIWKKSGNQKIWCLGIRSKGAYSLNVIFDKMILPRGGSLFIYNPDHSKVLGAFT